jgi:hypothetical protein
MNPFELRLSEFPSEVEGLILKYVSDIVKKRNGCFIMQLNKTTDVRFIAVRRFTTMAPLLWTTTNNNTSSDNFAFYTFRFDRYTQTGHYVIKYIIYQHQDDLETYQSFSTHYGFIDHDEGSLRRFVWVHISRFRFKDGSSDFETTNL